MKSFACIVLVLISCLVTRSFSENIKRFISVDVANVRERPNPKSDILLQLHINLEVQEIKRVNEWVNINFSGIANGWVHQNSLGDSLLSERAIRDSINVANDSKLKIKWAERLIAAFPGNDINWTILGKQYAIMGDTTGLESIRSHFSGKDAYIAMGFFGTTVLLGKLDSKGDFKSLACPIIDTVASMYSCDHFAKAKPQAISATGKRWYSLDGEVSKENFVLAKKGPNKKWQEKIQKSMSYLSLYLEGFDTEVQWYELGKSETNRIYSTQPIVNARREVKVNGLLGVLSIPNQLYPSDSSLRLPQDHEIKIYPYYSIGLYEATSNFNYGPDGSGGGYYGDEFTGLFDQNGKKIYPIVPVSPLYLGNEMRVQFRNTEFFSFKNDENHYIYGIFAYTTGMQDGGEINFDLIKINQAGEVKAFKIFSNYAGG